MSQSERSNGDADELLFEQEMQGVAPMQRDEFAVRKRVPADDLPARDESSEVMAEIDGLLSGDIAFDAADSDEHIEFAAPGVDRRTLKRLKRGEYSVEAHLDLHGKTRNQAKGLLEQFVSESRRKGLRCVVIVHGRGHHSEGGVPVLKHSVVGWLGRGQLGRSVLAFCSARSVDGGLGAMYVLLRR